MKRKPIVAIVGRPNVGKSTFVNRLVGHRKSIVDDLPGVTRDRIYFDVEWQNKWGNCGIRRSDRTCCILVLL